MTTLVQITVKSAALLEAVGVDNPALDARLLVARALGCERIDLVTQGERVLTDDEVVRVEALIARRVKREPVGRILSEREFWGLPIGLNEATLEPRPDSETLVEAVLRLIQGRHSRESGNPVEDAAGTMGKKNETPVADGKADWIPAFAGMTQKDGSGLRILDLGTGTGCLLLALLHELPGATGLGVDISPRAVQKARENAAALGLAERAEFRVNFWLEALGETFDVIVCNPPYIPRGEIAGLMPEVREHDPVEALDGGEDGLAVYRFLMPQLPYFLNPGGIVAFEVGQGQAEDVAAMLREYGFADVDVRKDLGGVERVVSARQGLGFGG